MRGAPLRGLGGLRLLAAVALAGCLVTEPATASGLAGALLKAERVEATFRTNANAVDRAADRATERDQADRAVAAAEAARLKAAAGGAFVADEALAAVRAAIDDAATPDVDLITALERFGDIQQRFASDGGESWSQTATQAQATWADRPDGPAIEQLAALMAQPTLARENALAAQRAERVLGAVLDRGRDALKGQEEATAREIEAMLASSRSADEPDPAVSASYFEAQRRAQVAIALAQLSPGDRAALNAFYRSDGGRAQRAAMVEAFARTTDAATRKMLVAYLGAER